MKQWGSVAIIMLLYALIVPVRGVETLSVEWMQKGGEIVPPETLKNGTASLSEIEAWTRAIRMHLPLEWGDLNDDGEPDVLAEIAHARGATGNRSYLLFVQSGNQFRYLGMTMRIARSLTYAESGRTYLLQVSDNGPGANVLLLQIRADGLASVGHSLDLDAGDMGKAEDIALFRDLTLRIMPESRLLAVFSPLPPDGRALLNPQRVAAAWENPNGWTANNVAIIGDTITATISSAQPLHGMTSKKIGQRHDATFAGQLLHLRNNSYVVLLPDDPQRYSTAHIFLVFYEDGDGVRFVFSQNLLAAENK